MSCIISTQLCHLATHSHTHTHAHSGKYMTAMHCYCSHITAGLAFNPFDGMAQAAPYLICMLLVPMHFLTHEVMLFFTAVCEPTHLGVACTCGTLLHLPAAPAAWLQIWTTNIHDTLQGDTEPIMGSAYHTLHHTIYTKNYGQFFIFWDWVFGTLQAPANSPWAKYNSPKPLRVPGKARIV